MGCYECGGHICYHGLQRRRYGGGLPARSICEECGAERDDGGRLYGYSLPFYEGKYDRSSEGHQEVCPKCWRKHEGPDITQRIIWPRYSAEEIVEATRRVNSGWEFVYQGLTLADVDIIMNHSGYWRKKETCGGQSGGCRNPLHGCLFNEMGIQHTVTFNDSPWRDERGRFTSQYATWRILRNAAEAALPVGGAR